jgi:hypothetical protein
MTRGSTGAHLSKEVRSGAVGHVAAPEPTSVGRCGLNLQLAWQHVVAHPTPYLDLELVCGVPGLHGANRVNTARKSNFQNSRSKDYHLIN